MSMKLVPAKKEAAGGEAEEEGRVAAAAGDVSDPSFPTEPFV